MDSPSVGTWPSPRVLVDPHSRSNDPTDACRFPSACYGVLRFIMEAGAKGCEVVVSGKLRAARAKSMKFTDGFMIHSGQVRLSYSSYEMQ